MYCYCDPSLVTHHHSSSLIITPPPPLTPPPRTGTCIGRRNYPFFLSFVGSVVAGAMHLFCTSVFVMIGWAAGLQR